MIRCKICNMEFSRGNSLGFHVKVTHKISTMDYYLKYINPNEDIKCPVCGKDRKFRSFIDGFYKTCGSKKCSLEIKRITCLNEYGTDHYSKTEEFKNKFKNTCLKKYNVEYPLLNSEIKDKAKLTNIERYGTEKYMSSIDFKEKYKIKMDSEYGTDHYSKTDEFKEKYKQTCLDRYGVDNYTKTDEYKEKSKLICLKKYGTEHPMKSKEIKDRLKDVILDKYGVDNYTKTDEYKELLHNIKFKYFIQNVKNNRPDVEFLEFNNDHYYRQYICKWICKHCGTIFEDYARATNNWLHPRCPTCNPVKYSSIENKVYNYLINVLNRDIIIRCDRKSITPYELDIHVPHLNLGIECDGDYWHSDEFLIENLGMTYNEHCKLKENLCENKDITLIRFTESEINNEFGKVKSIIDKYIF